MAYSARCKIHVRYNDIDSMGHVNNAVYLSYFEEARIDFFQKMIGKKWNWLDAGIIIARNEVDYHQPLLLIDSPEIITTCVQVGTKSFTVEYQVVVNREGKEVKCASGKSVAVCYDYTKGITIPVPEEWKKKMLDLE
jgi:acyl-CoA thioester hydrolase